jgi:hypothetical protein
LQQLVSQRDCSRYTGAAISAKTTLLRTLPDAHLQSLVSNR